MSECEKFKTLIMGLMDDELNPDEAAELNQHLRKCAACRTELEQLSESSEKMKSLSYKEPQDEFLDTFWKSPFTRMARLSGFMLVLAGWILLAGYMLYELLVNGSEAFIPRVATAAVFIGFFVLLITVIRERLITYKTDPYKEVIR